MMSMMICWSVTAMMLTAVVAQTAKSAVIQLRVVAVQMLVAVVAVVAAAAAAAAAAQTVKSIPMMAQQCMMMTKRLMKTEPVVLSLIHLSQ
jgi:hypothetical protein